MNKREAERLTDTDQLLTAVAADMARLTRERDTLLIALRDCEEYARNANKGNATPEQVCAAIAAMARVALDKVRP